MNKRICHTAGRNYCAPNGKVAALFADLDGTQLACQIYFDQATKNFGYFMQLRGFDRDEAIAKLGEIDRKNAEMAAGFERDRFGRSLVECYDYMVKQKKRRFKPADMEQDRLICENIGRAPFFREPELFPNCAAVLGRAHRNFLLYAVTIGNREAQKYKVRQAGLEPIFDELIITSQDNKAELVEQIIQDVNIDPSLSGFIGNSQRSDGACLQHTNFIYLPMEGGWAFDHAHALPQNSPYQVFNVKDWREAEEQAINRLLRRRRTLMALEQEPDGRTGAGADLGQQPGCCPRQRKTKPTASQ